MDDDVLMNRVNQIDENAFLVTIEGGEYVHVTDCSGGNAENKSGRL